MISSLWTLCQTCPSVAAGKLDGKYRWTEYRDVPTAARVIEHAPQCSGHSVTESSTRVRKDADGGQQQQQELSGVVHDFMEPTLAIPAHLKIDNQLYLQVLRRSQSEGPQRGVPGAAGVAAFEPGPMAAWVHGRRRHVTDQQRPDHWSHALVSAPPAGAAAAASGSSSLAVESRAPTVQENQKRVVVVAGETANRIITGSSEYQLQFAWPPGSKHVSNNRRMPESLDSLLHSSHDGAGEREAAGLLSSSQSRMNHGGTRSQEMVYHAAGEEQNEHADDQPRRRRYKTEYKKKFRPFSLYQYVDGRFQKSSSDKIPASDPHPPQQQQQQSEKDTWYREVLELRKKAGEYKYRGLGGELMSQHMADLYAKQFDVWEQVSRRSSLSALALAATTPRPGSEKDTSTAANSKRGSPAKTAPQNTPTRPGHAQPLLSSRKDNNTTRNKGADPAERARRDMSQQRSVSAEGGKSRSKSAKPAKSPAHQSGNVTLAIRPSLGAIFHPVSRTPARSASLGPERRMPKSVSSSTTGGTGPTTKTTPVKARPAHNNEDGCEPVKVGKNNKIVIVKSSGEGKENVIESEPISLSVIEQEPLPALIKALPEPTRVKSPEQLVVRSPDPVNWTVPLDTGKTFTVTQNIRGGDAGSRPHSELRVSMTVRPAPAAPVHSAPAVTNKIQQQEIVCESIDSKPMQTDSSVPAPVGAPDANDDVPELSTVDVVEEKAQTDEDQAAEANLIEVEEEEKKVEVVEEMPEPECKAEEPLVAEIKAQEEEKEEDEKGEEIKEVKETTRLPEEEQEQKDPASDPLGASTVLGKAQPKEETPVAAPVEPVTSIVPGTTLRRLEDPTPFLFSRPGTLGTLTGPPVAAPSFSDPPLPKAPRYRVLEAPGMMNEPVHNKVPENASGFQPTTNDPYEQPHPLQSAQPMMMGSSPYKVLEAPSSPPKSSAVASSPNASPMSNRSLASDVLEKARTRFDRFWTKKDSDK